MTTEVIDVLHTVPKYRPSQCHTIVWKANFFSFLFFICGNLIKFDFLLMLQMWLGRWLVFGQRQHSGDSHLQTFHSSWHSSRLILHLWSVIQLSPMYFFFESPRVNYDLCYASTILCCCFNHDQQFFPPFKYKRFTIQGSP